MVYQIILDNKILLSGNIQTAIVISSAVLLAIIFVIFYLFKLLRENGHLKYEFITIVAHKFRTPLTYIKWVCDSLIPEETDSFKKKSLEDVRKSNQKLIDLTGTLIEIADSETSGGVTYVYKIYNLAEIVRGVTNSMKDTFHEKNIFFSVNCNNENIKVKVDRSRFEFVLTTLLENAYTYTSPGKKVDVTIGGNLFRANVAVEDDGIGIPKHDLPHIASKFYRGKNAKINDTEGFGVGLYLASSIMKHFSGKIKIESPGEDMGSRFTIILPREY